MKHFYLFLSLFLFTLPLWAEVPSASRWDSLRYEVRVGYGDPIFESAMKYEFTHIGKPNARVDYVTGHIFTEFQYSFLWWLSVGMQLDYSGEGWHDRRELAEELYTGAIAPRHYYYNLSLLPTVRFTYYRSPWVNLYCALSPGMTINGGTETDLVRKTKTICYPAVGLTAIGVQVGQKGWFGTFELGGLSALLSKNDIVMLSSRMLSVSLGYRFQPHEKK